MRNKLSLLRSLNLLSSLLYAWVQLCSHTSRSVHTLHPQHRPLRSRPRRCLCVSCPEPGAPPNSHEPGYYYSCCSAAGHCGPKNNIREQSLYCGTGCQPGSGDCSTNRVPPRLPAGPLRPQETGRLVDRLFTLSVRVGCAVRVAIFAGLGQPSVGRRIGASRNWGCALEREQLVR